MKDSIFHGSSYLDEASVLKPLPTDNCVFCGTYIHDPHWLDLATATLSRRDDERALDQCRISMDEFHRRRRVRLWSRQ